MNYEKLCQQILENIGGEENIESVVHCATRLRFVLKDESKANDEGIKSISGVLSLVKKGGQYQLVIGNNVDRVYDELMKNLKIESGTKEDKRNWFNKIIGYITGSIAPVIPLLAGAGMGKVLLLVLTISGLLTKESQTYQFLNMIFDTGFYFMPAYVGFSAAKIFNTNQYLGAFIGLVTLHPTWSDWIAQGDAVHFLNLNMPLVKYSSTLIPAILSVWIMSYVEKGVKRIVPEMIKVFAEPMLVMLIMTPLTFLIIGPIGDGISQGVANLSMFLYKNGGFIAIPILAAIYPWLVSVGIHKALSPISIALVAEQGFDPIIRIVALCSNMSQAAASLSVSIKTKNKKLKSLAFSSSMTAFLGGITEPAMYGVNLKLVKPMYASMIGGAIGGFVAGLLKLKAFIYVTPGILSLPMWISEKENFVLQAILVMVISSVATFIMTWILGFDDSSFDDVTNKDEKPPLKSDGSGRLTKKILASPVTGEVSDLKKVSDETFASEVMGKGVALIPLDGQIVSPGNGTVSATFESAHAIGLRLEDDIELLIHVGIDTVSLQGKYFKNLVEKNQPVKVGDPLLMFDGEKLKELGYDTTVMMIVTNSNDYLDIEVIPEIGETIQKNEDLLVIF